MLSMIFLSDKSLQIEDEKMKARARAERFGLIFTEEDFKPVNKICLAYLFQRNTENFVRTVGCVDKRRI